MKHRVLAFAIGVMTVVEVRAEVKVLKHDEFSSDLFVAVSQVHGQSLPVQPGFAQNEAYAVIFPIAPGSYPVKVLGLQLILAAPPNAPTLKSHVRFEFYFDSSSGPAPSKADPDWAVSTEDLFDPNTGATGLPLQGGVGVQIDFDWNDPANHPPLMMSGNLWVVLRFHHAPQDLFQEWGTFQCMKAPEFGLCGCQKVGILGDRAITPKVAAIHHYAAGSCSGARTWSFAENLGVTGDAIVRVKVETAGTCVPTCLGKECGPDGCGGSCGTCPPGKHCEYGVCVPDCVPVCVGKECGPDGCGGSCGTCPAGKHCDHGACVPDCVPVCVGKECGPDGCGGSCGTCDEGEVCAAGICMTPSGVVVLEVSPSFGYNDEETPVTVAGKGFKPGLALRLGGTLLGAIQVVGEGLATAVVPAGMVPGWYTLFASNPDGTSGFLEDAFEVRERPKKADEPFEDQGQVLEDTLTRDLGPQDIAPDGSAPTSPGGGGCSSAPMGMGSGLWLIWMGWWWLGRRRIR